MLKRTDFSTRSSLAQGGALAALRTHTTASLSARRDATSRRMPCRMCSGFWRASAALVSCSAAAAIAQRLLSSRVDHSLPPDLPPCIFERQLGCHVGQDATPDVLAVTSKLRRRTLRAEALLLCVMPAMLLDMHDMKLLTHIQIENCSDKPSCGALEPGSFSVFTLLLCCRCRCCAASAADHMRISAAPESWDA